MINSHTKCVHPLRRYDRQRKMQIFWWFVG